MNRKVKLGQTYNKVRVFVYGFDQMEGVDILIFREGLSGSMGLMEVCGQDFLCMEREREGFAFWF